MLTTYLILSKVSPTFLSYYGCCYCMTDESIPMVHTKKLWEMMIINLLYDTI